MTASHQPNRYLRALLGLAVALCIPCWSIAAEKPKPNPTGLIKIAEMYGISVAEAQRRSDLTPYIQDMQRRIMEGSRETFAGLYIEQEPEFRVVVMFVGDARAQLSNYTLDPLFVPINAPRTLDHLKSVRLEISDQLKKANIEFMMGLNLKKSEIDLYVEDPVEVAKRIAALRKVAPYIRIHKTTGFMQRLSIDGGGAIRGPRLSASICTAGFNVVDANRELGLVTAGHCTNPSNYVPTSTPLILQREENRGSYDVEWHKQKITSSRPKKQSNKVAIPAQTEITSVGAVVVGQEVCKYGYTTGLTCGTVAELDHIIFYENEEGTAVRVTHPLGLVMAEDGDSGGPVMTLTTDSALGIVSGRGPAGRLRNDLFYMSIDKLSVLGISVVTEPFEITTIPNVSGAHLQAIPVAVNFKGYPRFTTKATVDIITCPSPWTCNGGVIEYTNTVPPPLTYTFTCRSNGPATTFRLRTTLEDASLISPPSVEHLVTCTPVSGLPPVAEGLQNTAGVDVK